MSYCLLVWGNSSNRNIETISRIQNNVFKILQKRGHVNPTCKFRLLNFRKLYQFSALLKFYQFYRLDRHDYFFDIVNDLLPNHRYETRFSADNIILPSIRLSFTRRNFLFTSITLWNSPVSYTHLTLPTKRIV